MLRKIIFIILLFQIIIFGQEIMETPEYASNQWYTRAYFLYNRGDYEESYKALMKALKLNPDNTKAAELARKVENIAQFEQLKLQSEIQVIQKETEALRQKLPKEEIIEEQSYPWDEFHFQMGLKYFKEKKYQQAQNEFIKTLDIFPDNVIADYYLYKIARSQKDSMEVRKRADKISKFVKPYRLWKERREEGEIDEIPEIIEIIIEYFRYFPGENFDEKFINEFDCYINKLGLENAYYKWKNLVNMEDFFYKSFPYKIITTLNVYEEKDVDFDIEQLKSEGLLSSGYSCPAGGDYVYIDGDILCTNCDVLPDEEEDFYFEEGEKEYYAVDQHQYMNYKQKGQAFLDKHRYDNALTNFLEAYNYFPDSYDLLNKIGVVYKLKNNHEEAQKYFEKSLEIKFDFIPAFNNLSAVYYEKEEYEKAVNTLNKALLINGSDFNIHYNLGLNLEKLEKEIEALKAYRNAALINGKKPDPYIRSAIIENKRGNYKKALEHLIKVKPLVEDNHELNVMVTNFMESLQREI
ncbi:MAG: tetratricopeptide repeat protein [Candidatus Muiribacteriota bacterium]